MRKGMKSARKVTRKVTRKTRKATRKTRKQIRRKRTVRRRRGGQLNPNASEFVPAPMYSTMSANSKPFVPTTTMNPNANEFIPNNIQNYRNANTVENMEAEGYFNEEKFPAVNLNFLNENKAKPNWNVKKPVLNMNVSNVVVPKKVKNIWAKNNSQ